MHLRERWVSWESGNRERASLGLLLGFSLTSVLSSEVKLMPGPARCPGIPLRGHLLQHDRQLASHGTTSLAHFLLGWFLLGLRSLQGTAIH